MGTQTPKAMGAEPQYSQETMNVGHEHQRDHRIRGVEYERGMGLQIYIYMYVCMYMYNMYMCIYVCIYVYMIVYMYIYRLTQTQ